MQASLHAKLATASNFLIEAEKRVQQPENNQEHIILQQIHTRRELGLRKIKILDPFWNNRLIVQRKLGHKTEMRGAAKWELISDFKKHTNGQFSGGNIDAVEE
jgi:hypothetical protein